MYLPDRLLVYPLGHQTMSERARLPQLLEAAAYYSQEQHDLEIERVLRPAWHCIGMLDEIPEKGDYITLDHFGYPLLIQNQGDRIAGFHNICAHRNSVLARRPSGNMERIKCGYHGWEYDRDGIVCKIPGGEYFKPIQPKEFALSRLRVETVGRLIFVTLSSSSPLLREFLGNEIWNRLLYIFGPSMRVISDWCVDYACNWKVLIENSMEDYHVSDVHSATVGATPPYKQISHTLAGNFIAYENRSPALASRSARWIAARIRSDAEFTYFQYLTYPAFIFITTPLTSHLFLVTPTSPTTCRARNVTLLSKCGKSIPARLLHLLLKRPAIRLGFKFAEEDRKICNDHQRGLTAARFPGVLGVREERVHAFQEYIKRLTGAAGSKMAAVRRSAES